MKALEKTLPYTMETKNGDMEVEVRAEYWVDSGEWEIVEVTVPDGQEGLLDWAYDEITECDDVYRQLDELLK